jgi:hypothetical protein
MGEAIMCSFRLAALVAALGFVASSAVYAAPYASGVTVSGTTVTFTLNEDADSLTYSLNGGAATPMPDGMAKGTHTFNLGSASDTFSIVADKTADGWTTSDGGTVAAASNRFSQPTAQSNNASVLISADANPLNRFNSPRGVSVGWNPNAPNFGLTYISNSAPSTTPPAGRTNNLGDGIYVLKADQSDAFGYGDTAQQNAFFSNATANTPYKLYAAADGNVYVSGFGDAISGVFRLSHDLLTLTNVLTGTTGPAALPAGQNHGSTLANYVTGSTAGGDLTVYTMDEDLTTAHVTGSGANNDFNSVWRYNINGSALPFSGMPTKVTSPIINVPGVLADFQVGADGKFYLSQQRAAPATATGVYVTDPSGAILFDSLVATRAMFDTPADYNNSDSVDAADYVLWRKGGTLANEVDNPGTVEAQDYTEWRSRYGTIVEDFYRQTMAITVSPDQKWMATLHNDNTIVVTPLVNGIPDMANRLAIPTSGTISGRDISFDAAGNLHYVSSGQGLYRVLAPGGHTVATTSWNGSSYAFNISTIPGSGSLGVGSVPEPGTLVMVLMGALALGFGRPRR